jgi:hypothetical protein
MNSFNRFPEKFSKEEKQLGQIPWAMQEIIVRPASNWDLHIVKTNPVKKSN